MGKKNEIEEFVFEVLTGILRGISRARSVAANEKLIPVAVGKLNGQSVSLDAHDVAFDLSLAVTHTSAGVVSGKADGLMVRLVAGEITADGTLKKEKSSAHRVSFSVPMYPNSEYSSVG